MWPVRTPRVVTLLMLSALTGPRPVGSLVTQTSALKPPKIALPIAPKIPPTPPVVLLVPNIPANGPSPKRIARCMAMQVSRCSGRKLS